MNVLPLSLGKQSSMSSSILLQFTATAAVLLIVLFFFHCTAASGLVGCTARPSPLLPLLRWQFVLSFSTVLLLVFVSVSFPFFHCPINSSNSLFFSAFSALRFSFLFISLSSISFLKLSRYAFSRAIIAFRTSTGGPK